MPDQSPDVTTPETETVTIELDPARSLMLQMVRNVGGEIPDNFIEKQVTDAIEKVYDERDQIATARQSMAESGGDGDASAPGGQTDIPGM